MFKRTYSELIRLPTFEERLEYLRLNGGVGRDTFGFDRYLNQRFYRSKEWKDARDFVIVRDNGCDLAMEGYDIFGRILIHHINPLSPDDIVHSSDNLLNPEYLVCVTHDTHNIIHYGSAAGHKILPRERTQNDTCPWRH